MNVPTCVFLRVLKGKLSLNNLYFYIKLPTVLRNSYLAAILFNPLKQKYHICGYMGNLRCRSKNKTGKTLHLILLQ